jgi:transposase
VAVAQGATFVEAARRAGHRCNEAVAALVARFNTEGIAAVAGHHGGGPEIQYGPEEYARILKEFVRPPDREKDGTATWSLTTLQRALRKADDGLAHVRTYVIFQVLRQAGYTWQKSRTWCDTGTVERKRVERKRKEGGAKSPIPTRWQKGGDRAAYPLAEQAGIPVWCEDEAGPYQALPQPGESWQPEGAPACQPPEYIRGGTAKLRTLFRPATGQVRALPVGQSTNAILHPWLKDELSAILAKLPAREPEANDAWGRPFRDWKNVGQAPSETDVGQAPSEMTQPLVRLIVILDIWSVIIRLAWWSGVFYMGSSSYLRR